MNAFFPSAENGSLARRQIQDRLAESIGHVLEQCRGKVPFDEASGENLLDILRSDRAVSPEIFSAYFRAVRAIMDHGDEPWDASRTRIEAALKTLLAGPFIAESGVSVRPLSPAYFDAEAERELRDNFVSESLLDEQIVTVDAAAADELAQTVGHAVALIREHAPETFSELERCVSEIVPASGRNSADGMEFGGCSSLERWGSILINSSAQPTTVVLCESIIHEGAHNVLFGTSPVEFHIRNGPDELRKSPLRVDPRPLDGIYHATFVLARMCYGMREFAASPTLDPALRTEARKRADEALKLFWDGYAVLDEHADYTDYGRAIMTAAHDYMAGLAASEPA